MLEKEAEVVAAIFIIAQPAAVFKQANELAPPQCQNALKLRKRTPGALVAVRDSTMHGSDWLAGAHIAGRQSHLNDAMKRAIYDMRCLLGSRITSKRPGRPAGSLCFRSHGLFRRARFAPLAIGFDGYADSPLRKAQHGWPIAARKEPASGGRADAIQSAPFGECQNPVIGIDKQVRQVLFAGKYRHGRVLASMVQRRPSPQLHVPSGGICQSVSL
jgi:hypothetical protein